MTRRLIGLAAALAVAVFAAACDEAPPTGPAADAPSLTRNTSTPAPTACVFSGNPSLPRAVATYLTLSSDRQAASTLISAMQAGFTASSYAGAQPKGFDLLTLLGKASRAGTGSSPAEGAAAVRMAIQCMFNVAAGSSGDFAGWPTDNQFDFAAALTPTAGGAFYVRGGTGDAASVVLARGSAGNISGLAPEGTNTWPSTVSNRVLIYGEPVTGGYDWKLIPRATSFTPQAVVALCEAAQPDGFDDEVMVRQQSVGVLGFVGPQADAICSQSVPVALRRGPLGSFAMLARLAQVADQLFVPQPLYASAALRSSTIGGSVSGAKGDPFTALPLPTVALKFSSPGVQPKATTKVNTRFSLAVNVATPDGEPAGGVTVTLTATTNNGTATGIFQVLPTAPATFVCSPSQSYIKPGAPTATTLGTVGIGGVSQATNATFTDLCFSKTGAVYVIASSKADLRTGGIGTGMSIKVNVKP
jgi:hypothetical protein